MRIHCDTCGAEIALEQAELLELNGETLYFCSARCRESKDYHETMRDPDPVEGVDAPDIR